MAKRIIVLDDTAIGEIEAKVAEIGNAEEPQTGERSILYATCRPDHSLLSEGVEWREVLGFRLVIEKP